MAELVDRPGRRKVSAMTPRFPRHARAARRTRAGARRGGVGRTQGRTRRRPRRGGLHVAPATPCGCRAPRLWTGALAAHLLLLAAAPFLPRSRSRRFDFRRGLPLRALRPSRQPVGRRRASRLDRHRGRAIQTRRAEARAWRAGVERPSARPRPRRHLLAPRALTPSRPTHSSCSNLTSQLSQSGSSASSSPRRLLLGTVVSTRSRARLNASRRRTRSRSRNGPRTGSASPSDHAPSRRPLDVPITWGVVYPVVCSGRVGRVAGERRRVVLVHEMAHVKRFEPSPTPRPARDRALLVRPARVARARRMRAEREHACDDYVLRDGTRPSLYAGELLDMCDDLASDAPT